MELTEPITTKTLCVAFARQHFRMADSVRWIFRSLAVLVIVLFISGMVASQNDRAAWRWKLFSDARDPSGSTIPAADNSSPNANAVSGDLAPTNAAHLQPSADRSPTGLPPSLPIESRPSDDQTVSGKARTGDTRNGDTRNGDARNVDARNDGEVAGATAARNTTSVQSDSSDSTGNSPSDNPLRQPRGDSRMAKSNTAASGASASQEVEIHRPTAALDEELTEPVSVEDFLRGDVGGERARLLGIDSPAVAGNAGQTAVSGDQTARQGAPDRLEFASTDGGDAGLLRLARQLQRDGRMPHDFRRRNPSKMPNILLVIVENLSREDIGAYGQPLIQTPFLDRLAAGGLRLTQCAGSAVGRPMERTALWYGDLSTATRSGNAKLLRLPRPDLPAELVRAGYLTMLLGECGWPRGNIASSVPTPHATTNRTASARANAPRTAVDRGSESESRIGGGGSTEELTSSRSVDAGAHSSWDAWAGWSDFADARFQAYPLSIPDHKGECLVEANRESPQARFDAVLASACREMLAPLRERRTAESPLNAIPALLVANVDLRWWEESVEPGPEYQFADWSDEERRHAAAVTALDEWLRTVYQEFDDVRGRHDVAVIVIGLPRWRKAKAQQRFRDAVPALDDARPGQLWPYAPVLAAWPRQIPAGRVVNAFCGLHDLLPTMLEMANHESPPRSGSGCSQWRLWMDEDGG
jgi:hypothetical protein